jgi:hypothetical protein
LEANGFLLQDRRATRSLFARTSLDRETSTSSTTTRQCREMKLRYGQEWQGMFLLWKNEANGKRHGDDTNHMTPRLRLHWLAHAVFWERWRLGRDCSCFSTGMGHLVWVASCPPAKTPRLAICTADVCVYSFWHSKRPHSSSAGSSLSALRALICIEWAGHDLLASHLPLRLRIVVLVYSSLCRTAAQRHKQTHFTCSSCQ